jgi:chromosome segregation ATPase
VRSPLELTSQQFGATLSRFSSSVNQGSHENRLKEDVLYSADVDSNSQLASEIIHTLRMTIRTIESENITLRTDLNKSREENEKYKNQLYSLHAQINNWESQLSTLSHTGSFDWSERKNLTDSLSTSNSYAVLARTQTMQAHEKLLAARTVADNLKLENESLKRTIASLSIQLNELKAQQEYFSKIEEKVESSNMAAIESEIKYKNQLKQLQTEREHAIKSAYDEASNARLNFMEMKKKYDQLEHKSSMEISELKSQILALTNELDTSKKSYENIHGKFEFTYKDSITAWNRLAEVTKQLQQSEERCERLSGQVQRLLRHVDDEETKKKEALSLEKRVDEVNASSQTLGDGDLRTEDAVEGATRRKELEEVHEMSSDLDATVSKSDFDEKNEFVLKELQEEFDRVSEDLTLAYVNIREMEKHIKEMEEELKDMSSKARNVSLQNVELKEQVEKLTGNQEKEAESGIKTKELQEKINSLEDEKAELLELIDELESQMEEQRATFESSSTPVSPTPATPRSAGSSAIDDRSIYLETKLHQVENELRALRGSSKATIAALESELASLKKYYEALLENKENSKLINSENSSGGNNSSSSNSSNTSGAFSMTTMMLQVAEHKATVLGTRNQELEQTVGLLQRRIAELDADIVRSKGRELEADARVAEVESKWRSELRRSEAAEARIRRIETTSTNSISDISASISSAAEIASLKCELEQVKAALASASASNDASKGGFSDVIGPTLRVDTTSAPTEAQIEAAPPASPRRHVGRSGVNAGIGPSTPKSPSPPASFPSPPRQ